MRMHAPDAQPPDGRGVSWRRRAPRSRPRLWIRAVAKPVADFLSDVEPVFAADPVW